ncbi:MAG: ABC transporter ATP-binding protein [Deltaproteobacteria bacterium HGW-Deltaproteobacteria-6]|jgi:putative ABC transport system ATP-binding protein|nr:MAG: ABC transporter ATP-binding protein [Deltaproteobacteria bacterium HGW-Deltaproteobacteria-6]
MEQDRHLIEIRGIGKNYQAGDTLVHAIREMNFYVDDGEFVGIMGQSGSGKSTLLSVIGGLNHPTKGSVCVDTLDVYGLTSEQRADFRSEYLGIVFQSFQLIPYLTVVENVKLPMAVTGIKDKEQQKRALQILERVGLENKARRLPDQLSGGEQERVAIARALVNQPPILLADEPTGNLDTETAESVMALLTALNDEGQTIIMVTHNPGVTRFASRTIHVKDGLVFLDEACGKN